MFVASAAAVPAAAADFVAATLRVGLALRLVPGLALSVPYDGNPLRVGRFSALSVIVVFPGCRLTTAPTVNAPAATTTMADEAIRTLRVRFTVPHSSSMSRQDYDTRARPQCAVRIAVADLVRTRPCRRRCLTG
jgi:hypothetical protein